MPLPHYRDHASGSNDIEDVELWVEVTRQSTRGLAEALLRSGKADNVSSQTTSSSLLRHRMNHNRHDDDYDEDASYWFCRCIITSLQTTSSLGGMKGKSLSLTHWIDRSLSIDN